MRAPALAEGAAGPDFRIDSIEAPDSDDEYEYDNDEEIDEDDDCRSPSAGDGRNGCNGRSLAENEDHRDPLISHHLQVW